MTPKELQQINLYKKDFKEKFGSELIIDVLAMNGISSEIPILKKRGAHKEFTMKFLNDLLKKYSIDLETFINMNRRQKKDRPESYNQFMKEYCRAIISNNWDRTYCMDLIKRDRTCINYHLRIGRYATTPTE